MKKIFLILVIASLFIGEAFAQVTPPSTQGSEFYFSIMRGRHARSKDMTLSVSSPSAGIVKFTSSTGVVTNKNINVGITKFTLASITSDSNSKENDVNGDVTTIISGEFPDCYTIKSNNPENKGYTLEVFEVDGITPLKVSIFAGLSGNKTVDVANVYPIEALGNKYYVISRSGNSGKDMVSGLTTHFPSEVLIVATEDNTEIDIYPTCLLDNQSLGDDIYDKIHITLDKGQTYLIRAWSAVNKDPSNYGITDLTGTLVKVTDDGGANKCRKIAVFSGTQHGSGENDPYDNGDYEYDQLFPTHLWGNNFVVGSTTSYGTDVIRIVAAEACTDVYINGSSSPVATLNQSEMYEYKNTTSSGVYINTTKPVEVGLFTTGQLGGSNVDGGPSLIVIAPMEQYLNSVMFTATYNANVSQHSMLVTSLTDICQQTTLNGTAMTPANGYNWAQIPSNSDYSTVIVAGLDPNITYTLENIADPSQGGFNAYLYGSQGNDAGYGYSVGSAARSSETSFFLNGDPSLNSKSVLKPCVGTDVLFEANVPYSFSEIIWEFGDGVNDTIYSPDNTTTHAYSLEGTYTVIMTLTKNFSECYGDLGLTIVETADIQIVAEVEYIRAETLCKGSTISSNRAGDPIFGGLPVKYYWDDGINTQSRVLTDDHGVIKRYIVKTYDTSCHVIIDTIDVTTRAPFPATYTENHCNNKGETLNFQSATPFTNGDPITYKWNTDETTSSISVIDGFGTTTKHWVEATTGCLYIDTINVTIPAKVNNSLIAGPLTHVCGDGTTEITVTATQSGPSVNTWEISENGGAFVPMVPSENPLQHKFFATAVGSVETSTFRYTSTGVCETFAPTATVTANPPFVATLDATSNEFTGPYLLPLSGGTVDFEVTTNISGSFTYQWTPNVASASNYSVIFDEDSKDLIFSVVVSDMDNLCNSSTNILEIKMLTVKINTIIYPSGTNNRSIAEDLSTIFTKGYKTTVYNRYGQLVSEKVDGGWDGTYKGQAADAGVYFYVLEYNTANGKKAIKGSVEVVK